MTKIDIVSGFLGAGKTTLIKKLLKEALADMKVVLIENEFGEIGIDGGFLKEAGIEIKEMNSGCICCSLVGDFGASLKEVLDTYAPERILIEPSGVGKLSDVMKAVEGVVSEEEVQLNSAVAVVDAMKCKMYMKNFGEFFTNQIEHAGTIILSRTGKISGQKLEACLAMIREHNQKATIVTTPWEELDGRDILETIEGAKDLEAELMEEVRRKHENEHHHDHGPDCTCGCHGHHHGEQDGECGHGHGHHHGEEGEECCHGHGHHHGEHDGECNHGHGHHHGEEGEGCCHGHGHHHGEHDGECNHGHGHHHGEEGEECGHGHDHHHGEHGGECNHNHSHGHHDHDGHHHHHADEVFTSWGMETPAAYTEEEIQKLLEELEQEKEYGFVLRAKGMVPSGNGSWVYFDYVPGECDIREGKPDVTGKICVIGSKLVEDNLKKLFQK
ncbi:MAG: cobalamin biosynthesis protein CobW [Lachnospiraceae bacterium]|nr:cobalamin biosynthesis protein CobW [Lachnospiraceae bacterium]